MVTNKNIEPFLGTILMLSGDVLQLVLKDDVSDKVVPFYEDIPLELLSIFDSTTSHELSCKCDTEDIIFY